MGQIVEVIEYNDDGTPKKFIEIVMRKVGQLKDGLGNPRKITSKRRKELQDSLEEYGDFDIISIDHRDNLLSGHQRVASYIASKGEDHEVACKRLVGYTDPELKAINLLANTHAGEWDMSKLAEWTAQLTKKVNIDVPKINDINERMNRDMELIRYEKYDYVMIVCRNEIDYLNLTRALGIEDKKVVVCHTSKGDRKIKARAIWYDQVQCEIKKKS